jgi:serine protease Do
MRKLRQRVILVLIILFASFSLFTSSGNNVYVFGKGRESPLKESDEVARVWEIQKIFRDIYDLYKNRVVFISTQKIVKLPPHPFFNDPFFRQFFRVPKQKERKRKMTGLGTGFILSDDGYICTNHHVVAGMDKVTVRIDGQSYVARVIGSDQHTDIALLKIKPKGKLESVFIGDSDKVRVGDWAIAIGNPFGLDKTFTVGVISATGRRDVDFMGGSQSHIQTDASINPGNSGGPLINIRGEVIGINRMIYTRSGGYMGIGFAIPINTAKSVLAQLKKYKKVKRGYMGVQIVPLKQEYVRKLGLREAKGALVGGIVDNSPAERGGVQIGDVILNINGKEIKRFSDLVDVVGKTPIGKTVKIKVWRNKRSIALFVTIAERP